MNRVEVLGYIRVRLVGKGCSESGSGGVSHGISIVEKVGDGALCSSMALNIRDNRVSVTVLLLKVHITNLDEAIDLVTNVDVSGNSYRVIGDFTLESNLGLQTEDEGSARFQGFGLVAQLEPLLREENTD